MTHQTHLTFTGITFFSATCALLLLPHWHSPYSERRAPYTAFWCLLVLRLQLSLACTRSGLLAPLLVNVTTRTRSQVSDFVVLAVIMAAGLPVTYNTRFAPAQVHPCLNITPQQTLYTLITGACYDCGCPLTRTCIGSPAQSTVLTRGDNHHKTDS